MAWLVSCFGFECLDFKESSYGQLPGSLSPDYKCLHARQIPHQLSFPSQTIPDCIRYIIGVFCYNFKSEMNILHVLAHINTLACVKAEIWPMLGIYTSHTICRTAQA